MLPTFGRVVTKICVDVCMTAVAALLVKFNFSQSSVGRILGVKGSLMTTLLCMLQLRNFEK